MTVKVTRTVRSGRPSKLTEEQKNNLVTQYNEGMNVPELATMFKVSEPTVRKILKERR